VRPALDDIAPSKLAYHLKELREAGLVTEQRKGKWVYYTIDEAALERFTRRLLRRYLGARAGPSTCTCRTGRSTRSATRPR
jgi:ArsR family transcriptional regulator